MIKKKKKDGEQRKKKEQKHIKERETVKMVFFRPDEQAAYDAEEDEMRKAYEEEEAEEQRRREVLNLEYKEQMDTLSIEIKMGVYFINIMKLVLQSLGNKKDGLLDPKQALDAVVEARKQQNTMSSGTSSNHVSPNVNTGAPKPWMQNRTSRSTGRKYWWNPVTQVTFYSTKPGVWTKEEADKAAERAKKKGGKNQEKRRRKRVEIKEEKRKKTKKRKLRKKRKTRR